MLAAVHRIHVFDDVLTDKPTTIRLQADYPSDNEHFTVETSVGSVQVHIIEFVAELRITETMFPIMTILEYGHHETGEPIAQLAAFTPQNILGMNLSIEMRHMTESGMTHVSMRRVRDDSKPKVKAKKPQRNPNDDSPLGT
jgi:hypothetical protein